MPSLTPAGPDGGLTISEAAEALGTTVDTIRYYETEGIAPAPERGLSGWRRYDPSTMGWLAGVLMLRGTGMNIQQMREYAAAYQGGASTEDRLALLEQHHAAVLERLADVHLHLSALERKIDAYREAVRAGAQVPSP